MADLPRIGGPRHVAAPRRAIVSDRSGAIIGDALERTGAAVAHMGAVRQEREDRFNYARAKSALLKADIEARAELERDQDYETHEQRYSERMKKARDAANALIRSESDRALFGQDADLDIARGTAAIRGNARTIEVDRAMADLSGILETNRAAALQAKDEPTRTAIINNSLEAIGGARAKYGDRLSEVEAAKLRESWTHDYALARIEMMPTAERIEVLKGAAPPAPVKTTTLSSSDEARYREWMQKIGHTKGAGYEVDDNFSGTNYDYRGYFKKYGAVELGKDEHLTDEFKLPTHPTFSNESVYAVGANAARAGKWDGETYIPPAPAGSVTRFLQPDERTKLLKAALAEDHELQVRTASIGASDSIMQKHGGDLGAALAAARGISDPEVRDAATARVKQRFAEDEAIEAERHDKVLQSITTRIEQGVQPSEIEADSWVTILSQNERQAIEARAKQLRDGETPTTDLALWYERQQEAVHDPDAFARRNLLLDRASLSDGDFKGLANLQAAVQAGDGDKLITGIRTNAQVVEGALNEIGIPFGQDASKEQNDIANQFRYLVDQRAIDFERQNGRKPNSLEVQQMTDELIVQGEVPGTLLGIIPWNSSKRRFEVGPDEPFFVGDVGEVPAEDRRQIEAALRRRGMTVSDADVLRLFNMGLATQ